MFTNLPPYTNSVQDPFWQTRVPAHWQSVRGMTVLAENKVRNNGLAENQVLSLSHGRVVKKPTHQQHGLVPASYEGYQVLSPGNVVIRPTDLQNDQRSIRVGLVADRGIITPAYIGLQPRQPWNPFFAYLYLATVDLTKRIYGMGSGLRQQLSWNDIKSMRCLVPPTDEQQAIVKYLAHATARIDKAIASKLRLIALVNERKSATVYGAIQSQVSEPRALKHVLHALIDCEHKTAPFVPNTQWWILRTSSIRYGDIDWSGAYTTDEYSFREWTSRGLPEAGDVVFTREAPVGEAAVLQPGYSVALGQRTVLLKVRRDIIVPEFLVYQIYSGLPRRRIEIATQGSTVGHFNLDDIGWMQVSAPNISRQAEIVDMISRENAVSNRLISQTDSEITLLQEFRRRLIADVVTGQVDVRAIAADLPDVDPTTVWGSTDAADESEDPELDEAVVEGA